ncbi:MAG: RNA polymerase-associated protein RapA [Cellvibrionales bacterium]|nr:RNA polymerase-associated protein RapA [Cellvibrionales bacterium]
MSEFVVGQRWISHTEASLGLGVVVAVQNRRVTIQFPAVGEERVYAMDSAPLSRITYKSGDQVNSQHERDLLILDTFENNGLMFYKVQNLAQEEGILPETELDAIVHFSSPLERMISGQVDPLKFYQLRAKTHQTLASYQHSDVLGLLGPRVQLLPHQLYIAHQVSKRSNPRVLLADEVGLGKTIEAGLIIHQRLMAGTASRVLILVPDSLLHQWLVEMLRRFNLAFSVLDDELCNAMISEQDNPFDARQLVLSPLSFLVNNPTKFKQALDCDWDLLVVDEAHHLQWEAHNPSVAYQRVEALAEVAKGVLLLTATPEQLGVESHFARLRLLDPNRYFDLDAFVKEESSFQSVNALVETCLALSQGDKLPQALHEMLGAEERVNLEDKLAGDDFDTAKQQVIDALLDRHGTGRVLFRNTRQAVEGFPKRLLVKHPIKGSLLHSDDIETEELFRPEAYFGDDWLTHDARVAWLVNLLKNELSHEKVLLICQSMETAMQLENVLSTRKGIRSAVFHEGLSLINRDRAAAYFASHEDAAQILVCSEIGSEGRNFQFASHLVLFDLPSNPDLLEQRIGRLDRLGQKSDVTIHVPFYEDSPMARWLSWLHEGVNAFEQTCVIGQALYEEYKETLNPLLIESDDSAFECLLNDTQAKANELREALHLGRDKLLELNSCRPEQAEAVIDQLVEAEQRKELEDYLEQLTDQLGIEVEAQDNHSIIMRPSENMRCGLLPGMRDEGATYTFSRDNALSRDDLGFLTWEHPTVKAGMEHVLSSEHGNTCVATISLKPLPPGTLLVETRFVLNAIADKSLQIERFLPEALPRFLINQDGKDFSHILTEDKLEPLLKKLPLAKGKAVVKQTQSLLEELVETSESLAKAQLPAIQAQALETVQQFQLIEINRLKALAEVNPSIRKDEIQTLESELAAMTKALKQSDLMLDSLRLILAI